MLNLMAKHAHEKGTDSQDFKLAFYDWVSEIAEKGSHQPPIEPYIYRNGIQLQLQSVKISEYRYVPLDKFDPSKFCIELEPLRERILREIRIGKRIVEEIELIDAGLMDDDIVEDDEGD